MLSSVVVSVFFYFDFGNGIPENLDFVLGCFTRIFINNSAVIEIFIEYTQRIAHILYYLEMCFDLKDKLFLAFYGGFSLQNQGFLEIVSAGKGYKVKNFLFSVLNLLKCVVQT